MLYFTCHFEFVYFGLFALMNWSNHKPIHKICIMKRKKIETFDALKMHHLAVCGLQIEIANLMRNWFEEHETIFQFGSLTDSLKRKLLNRSIFNRQTTTKIHLLQTNYVLAVQFNVHHTIEHILSWFFLECHIFFYRFEWYGFSKYYKNRINFFILSSPWLSSMCSIADEHS